MSSTARISPLQHSNAEALNVSQQAGTYLQKNGSTRGPIALPYLSNLESTEQWKTYENLLYSCLRTGDDKAAHSCLEKLAGRFGAKNERVMGLRGLYQEAVADGSSELDQTLHEYDKILAEDNTNTVRSIGSLGPCYVCSSSSYLSRSRNAELHSSATFHGR